jgi:hypothetical protein
MFMKATLKDLATVRMGYSFRARLEASSDGVVAVIQMKDLLADHTVACGGLTRVDLNAVKNHHFVRKDDLVFRSRGQITTAAILRDDPGPAVVAAPLLRIRITKPGRILPEYLNWYISQRDAQAYLASRSEGTALKKIGKHELEAMEIALPSLEKQRGIVELATLSSREQAILNSLAEKRNQYLSTVLMQFAKEEI